MSFPTYIDLNYGMERLASTTKAFPIGMKGVMPDGRVFRYCLADANLGNHLGAASGDVIHEQQTAGALEAGDFDITIVMGSGAEDKYAGGFIEIHPPAGGVVQAALKVKGNDASGGTNMVLHLAEPILVDVDDDTFTGLHESAYNSIIVKTGGTTSVVVVPRVAITSGEYFWGQTRGPTICTAGFGSGQGKTANERSVWFNTDGAIGCPTDLTITEGYQYAGYMIHDTAATDDIFFYLQLE